MPIRTGGQPTAHYIRGGAILRFKAMTSSIQIQKRRAAILAEFWQGTLRRTVSTSSAVVYKYKGT